MPRTKLATPWRTQTEYGTLRVRDNQHRDINIQGSDTLKRHVVACVNACAKVDPKAVPLMLKALKAAGDGLTGAICSLDEEEASQPIAKGQGDALILVDEAIRQAKVRP